MNSIVSIWSALANFARSLNRLAAVADKVADEAERRVEITHVAPLTIEQSEPTMPAILRGEGLDNGHAEVAKAGRARR